MIKGVNLGNWLVLEKWMSPGLFAGTEAEDETQLSFDLADVTKRERLTAHRDSYITQRDFAYLAHHGSGLGYTDIALTSMQAPASVAAGETFPMTVEVENRGTRDGKQVVQIFAERPDSVVDRPVRWLVGSAIDLPLAAKVTLT